MNRALFSLAALTGLAFGQDGGGVVFRSDVSLVRVDVQVLDQGGRAITGLERSDFLLRENGVAREIRSFSNENMPVDVLILVDVSTSMRPHVERVAAASQDALAVLGADDRVGMMVFDRQTRLRLPFRGARTQEVRMEFGRLLNQESFSGGTDVMRGLLDAARYVKRDGRPGVRRAVVILTDDRSEFDSDEQRIIRAMTEADAVVSVLQAPDAMGIHGGGMPRRRPGSSWPFQNGGGLGTLGDILLGGGRYPGGGGGGGRNPGGGGPRIGGTQWGGAREAALGTGGDVIQLDDASAFERTLSRIRQRYALFFTVPDGVRAGAERSIGVELAGQARQRYRQAELRYRKTYIVPEGTAVSTAQPGDPEPVVASSTSQPEDEPRPTTKRRPAVQERSGPAGPSSADAPAAATTTTAPASGTATTTAAKPETKTGGWRRATDADLKP